MRSARIRTGWKNKRRQISVEEHAAAVAAVAWRVALNAAGNLHEQSFIYDHDEQRLAVMREYLYFFIHVADRCVHRQLDHAHRARFITHLSHECRRHYRENERDIMAQKLPPGHFIDQLNHRTQRYATTRFVNDTPGYQTFRALGLHIQDCISHNQTNQWTQDQILEIDGPEALRIFNKALQALNESVEQTKADIHQHPD